VTARLKIKGDGSCCDCGNMDGCECRKCSKLECRSRGGNVRLCGHEEFDVPENATRDWTIDPMRYFKRLELGGSLLVCDYHSPDPMVSPCNPDPCVNSPVGWSIEISGAFNCRVEGECPGNDLFVTTKLEVVSSEKDQPSAGRVRLGFSMTGSSSGCATSYGQDKTWSWLGYVNSILFIGSFSGDGSATAFRDATNGTVLGFSAELGANCSGGGVPYVITKCTGPGGDNCVTTESFSLPQQVDGLEYCHPASSSTRYVYSGAAVYDPAADCDNLFSDTRQRRTIDWQFGCSNVPSTGGTTQATTTAFEPAKTGLTTITDDYANRHEEAAGTCDGDTRVTECDRFEALSEEDTEQAGIDRLLAGPAGTWSDWQIVLDGTNGTCLNPACCRAAWQPRVERLFEYREAEYRATIEPLPAGAPVTIRIAVYRRPWAAPPYDLFQTLEYDVTANAEGKAIVEGEVPNERGFETYVSCTYTPATP
jgi:hypothetical protein